VFNPLHLGRSTGVTRAVGRLVQPVAPAPAHAQQAVFGGQQHGHRRWQPGRRVFRQAEPNLNFTDIDLLGVGPVAEQLGHSFDQYWNSALSRPIGDYLSGSPMPTTCAPARQRLEVSLAEAASSARPCTTG
jgi:putative cardiolipin synthase